MVKEQRVRIVVDSDPMSPREWDNISRMICWHDNYNLGDKHDYDCAEFMRELAFEADSDLEERVDCLEKYTWHRLYDRAIDRGYAEPCVYADGLVGPKVDALIGNAVREGYVILPLYLYDHSGITMSTGSFSCPWDSGQVGWIVCDNETIKREFNGDRDLAEKALQSEVEVYDDYLTGNVCGFIMEEGNDDEGWEHIDSCFGFFGSDIRTNGMSDHLNSEELIELAENAEIEYP